MGHHGFTAIEQHVGEKALASAQQTAGDEGRKQHRNTSGHEQGPDFPPD